MATIRYSYTHYQFNKQFSEPLTEDQFKTIKADRRKFEKKVETEILDGFYKNRDRHETSALFYKIAKIALTVAVGLGLIYLLVNDQLSSSINEIFKSLMYVSYVILSFSMIGSLSYWRSKRQFKVMTNSITRYYGIHTDLAFNAKDYANYLKEIENKKEYFDTLTRQRAFYESQQL